MFSIFCRWTWKFSYYIALGCVEDETPGQRDAEEWIEVVHGVSVDQVRDIVARGEMNTPHSLLAMLALDYLERNKGETL